MTNSAFYHRSERAGAGPERPRRRALRRTGPGFQGRGKLKVTEEWRDDSRGGDGEESSRTDKVRRARVNGNANTTRERNESQLIRSQKESLEKVKCQKRTSAAARCSRAPWKGKSFMGNTTRLTVSAIITETTYKRILSANDLHLNGSWRNQPS